MTESFGILFLAVHPNSLKTLSAPGLGLGTDPRAAPRLYGMFWKLVPKDVIDTPAEFTNADCGFMWRVKKDKMEVATGRTWTKREWGPRTLQMREYVPRELWAIFVGDGPFNSDAFYKHANVQSKAGSLLRYDGDGQDLRMDRRREMGGFKICGMHVDLHQMCADRGTKAHSRNAGDPETEDVIHHAQRELGLRRSFRRP